MFDFKWALLWYFTGRCCADLHNCPCFILEVKSFIYSFSGEVEYCPPFFYLASHQGKGNNV